MRIGCLVRRQTKFGSGSASVVTTSGSPDAAAGWRRRAAARQRQDCAPMFRPYPMHARSPAGLINGNRRTRSEAAGREVDRADQLFVPGEWQTGRSCRPRNRRSCAAAGCRRRRAAIREAGRVVAVGGREVGDDALRLDPHRLEFRQTVEPGVEEALEFALLAASSSGKSRQRRPAAPHIVDRLDARFATLAVRSPPARRRPYGRSCRGPARAASSRSERPGWRCPIASHRRADQRQLDQFVEIEQAGTKPVVDIVIVIGDIVGDRRDLRLEAGPAVELEVPFGIGLAPSPRSALRPVRCAWRAPPALPS